MVRIKQNKKILDLGSGIEKIPGAIRIDNNPEVKPDILHDLNIFPYPFESDKFDEIHLNNILLHLEDIFSVMREIHRLVKPEGKVIIRCAYFRSNYAFHYPGNKNHFTVDTFNFFNPSHPFFEKFKYTKTKFSLEKIVFNENFNSGIFKKIIALIANKFPNAYESKLSHIFPLDEIKYLLKKII